MNMVGRACEEAAPSAKKGTKTYGTSGTKRASKPGKKKSWEVRKGWKSR